MRKTPDVPILAIACSGRTIPAPIAPHALSAPPAKIGTSFSIPSSKAISSSNIPTRSSEFTKGGQIESSISNFCNIVEFHSFLETSNNKVPAASE